MAATNGTLDIYDVRNQRTVSIDAYVPDAVATFLTWNPTGLAASTSPTQLVCPCDGFIVDFETAGSAPTAVGFNIQLDSGSIPGNTLRHANQLSSLATRRKIRIPVRKGQIITALQF